nr:MAG TPA: hypothetical protein [Bacteriophage sp.]
MFYGLRYCRILRISIIIHLIKPRHPVIALLVSNIWLHLAQVSHKFIKLTFNDFLAHRNTIYTKINITCFVYIKTISIRPTSLR